MGYYQAYYATINSAAADPQRVDASFLSKDVLPLLGVRPAIGRWFAPEDEPVKAELRGSKYGAPARFKGTNICYYFGYNRGDVEEGFKKSDYVFEDTFRFAKVQHYSLETHVNVAYFNGDKLTVWSSCQDPFTLRDHLAGIFNLPLSRVRVIVLTVGGAYGGPGRG